MEKNNKKILKGLMLVVSILALFVQRTNVKAEENLSKTWDYNYTGEYQTFISPVNGCYDISLWGASGGKNLVDNAYTNTLYVKQPGLGGYTKGNICLNKGYKLYIYVGGYGLVGVKSTIVPGGWWRTRRLCSF